MRDHSSVDGRTLLEPNSGTHVSFRSSTSSPCPSTTLTLPQPFLLLPASFTSRLLLASLAILFSASLVADADDDGPGPAKAFPLIGFDLSRFEEGKRELVGM